MPGSPVVPVTMQGETGAWVALMHTPPVVGPEVVQLNMCPSVMTNGFSIASVLQFVTNDPAALAAEFRPVTPVLPLTPNIRLVIFCPCPPLMSMIVMELLPAWSVGRLASVLNCQRFVAHPTTRQNCWP